MREKFSDRILKTPQSMIREILKVTEQSEMISFAGGLPNPNLFPVQDIAQSSQAVFEEYGAQVLQYTTTEGELGLREWIANQYNLNFGWNVEPDEILITNGSQQAFDLIAKVFLNQGDSLIIEKPSYSGAIQSFSLYEPEWNSISLCPDGIDIDELEQILQKKNPKFAYLIPDFQNPSGVTYSNEKRKKVAQLLNKYSCLLVEDNPYGDLFFTENRNTPICNYLDDYKILLGSFSKTIAPGFRLGWIYTNKDIIQKLVIAKQACDLHSNHLSQKILSHYLENYDFASHLVKIRNEYKKQRDFAFYYLQEVFQNDILCENPSGGMFLWCQLPDEISSSDFLQEAMKEGVVFVPGNVFLLNQDSSPNFRLSYSNLNPEKIKTGIDRLYSAFVKFKQK
ncbi:MAG: 2-aminoadipate transaminase [bacterium]|jgi:2-aminoadipate transaminase